MPAKKRKRGRNATRASKPNPEPSSDSRDEDASKPESSEHISKGLENKQPDENDGEKQDRADPTSSPAAQNGKVLLVDLPNSLNPVILQCSSCRSILADTSNGFLESSLENGTISCTAARGVSLSSTVTAEGSGIYSNCAYRVLSCEQCNQVVGRKFVSTTTQFDSIRDAYTFDISTLLTYKLGSSEPTACVKPLTEEAVAAANATEALHEVLRGLCESMNGLSSWMRAMHDENTELRQHFLALEHRLQHIEKSRTD